MPDKPAEWSPRIPRIIYCIAIIALGWPALLHKNNCFGLASLANLDKLPPKGAILIAAPLKIQHGTGSPIRALALVPKD